VTIKTKADDTARMGSPVGRPDRRKTQITAPPFDRKRLRGLESLLPPRTSDLLAASKKV
jgi:hypothetical protein